MSVMAKLVVFSFPANFAKNELIHVYNPFGATNKHAAPLGIVSVHVFIHGMEFGAN